MKSVTNRANLCVSGPRFLLVGNGIKDQNLGAVYTHRFWGGVGFASWPVQQTKSEIHTHTHTMYTQRYMQHTYICNVCAYKHTYIHTYPYFRNHEFTPMPTVPVCIHRVIACFPPFHICISLLPL